MHNLAFSTSNNRITTAGFSYDANGNLTNDTVHAYTFDAENKIKTVAGVTAYTYDGEGQRVRKLVGENTRFVYGLGGQLIAEFDGSTGNLKKEYLYGGTTLITIEPTAVNSNGTQYTTSDNLGSARAITNVSGSVVSRHDYLPFGEELPAGTGGRTTQQGYSASDGVRQQFTSKERDKETGLDYFINRYYSSTQGRFTSADPIPMTSQRPSDPQRLNLYSYVRNNPLVNIDPNGLDLYATGSEAQRYVDDLQRATKLKLKLDSKTGKITIVGEDKKLSKEAQRIKTIIGDPKNTVRIEAIRDTAGTRQVVGGQFEGGGRQTLDYADIDKFGKQKGGTTPESVVIHETTEAYEGLTNPQSLAATSLFQQFTPAHNAAIEYENSYRRGQGLGERIERNQVIMTQGNETLVVVDYATHKERVVVDNNTQQIKSVQVIKKQ